MLRAMLEQLGAPGNMSVEDLRNQLNRDINALDPDGDQATGVASPTPIRRGTGSVPRTTALAEDPDLPLFVELNSTFTDIVWDPLSLGINYVTGPSAYKADPRCDPNCNTISVFTYIGKELIIAGGQRSVTRQQIEHNNGIVFCPAEDLGIRRGRDIALWPVPYGFEGYWPGYLDNYGANAFTIAFALKNTHSSQGTVTLRSVDPLDPPDVNFRFFEKEADQDLQAMLEAVSYVGNMKTRITNSSGLVPIEELSPCPSTDGTCTGAGIKDTLRKQVYSRHATGTCAIGDTASDPMAVLDSEFRVKGVDRLRIVDASVFPKPPGAFPILPTFMISRKAAKVIVQSGRK
ncbi:hypothetical protein CHU98_g8929 [Xylaria longipes]|nr:hypothetical protein CHU98_g8929 [Xylaria longipes]